MNTLPIGVFDSGLGGLTVVKEIRKILPSEDIIYLGDTARVPYGTRSKETIVKFAIQDTNFLLKKKVKCIVVACNTASANALNVLQDNFQTPIIGVIKSGVNGALFVTKNKRVGVLGTRSTISSHAYKKMFTNLDKMVKVFEESAPLFVPFIEEGEINESLITLLIKKYLSVFKNKDIDTLILGCTHYPIIEGLIKVQLPNVEIINPGIELAKELRIFLRQEGMENSTNNKGVVNYFVTDLTARFRNVASMFLEEKIEDKITKISLD